MRRRGLLAEGAKYGLLGLAIFLIVPIVGITFGLSTGDAMILATGLVVFAYTIVTYQIRLETVRQNEIAIQPLLITSIESPPLEGDRVLTRSPEVILRNIGRGPALFIQVKDLEVANVDKVRFAARFDTVDCIEAGKYAVANVNLYTEASEEVQRRSDFISNLNPRYANDNYKVKILYEDINGQQHESVMSMGKDGIRLLKHGKV